MIEEILPAGVSCAEEFKDLRAAVEKRRREFATGRHCAHEALQSADSGSADDQVMREALDALAQGDGIEDRESRGSALLVRLRDTLVERTIGEYLGLCKIADPDFMFRHNVETPLRMLLTERPPEIMPRSGRPRDWRRFLRAGIGDCVLNLKWEHEASPLSRLRWGQVNRLRSAPAELRSARARATA